VRSYHTTLAGQPASVTLEQVCHAFSLGPEKKHWGQETKGAAGVGFKIPILNSLQMGRGAPKMVGNLLAI